jgi:hypothetical protein
MSKKIPLKIIIFFLLGVFLFSIGYIFFIQKNITSAKNPDEAMQSAIFETVGEIISLNQQTNEVTIKLKTPPTENGVVEKKINLSQTKIQKSSSKEDLSVSDVSVGENIIFIHDKKDGIEESTGAYLCESSL